MADAAIFDINEYIIRADGSSLKIPRREAGSITLRCIAPGGQCNLCRPLNGRLCLNHKRWV